MRATPEAPQSKHTAGTNLCLVHPVVDSRAGRLIVVSAKDDLVKGAAGRAVQNMNVIFGFPEEMGLRAIAIYP